MQVRPGDSSAWVHVLSILARRHVGSTKRVMPYAQAGVSGAFSRLNRETRLGLGPQAGLGLDVTLKPGLTGFAEFNAALLFPGDAVDRVDTNGAPGDLLTFAGMGLRYRLDVR